MASIRDYDLEATRRKLQTWFAQVRNLSGVSLSELHVPQSGGMVNDTFVFDATWTEADHVASARLVCRAEPMGYSNLQSNDVLDQARTLEALGRVPDLPVPRVIAIESDPTWLDRPFYVMEALPGVAAPDVPPYTVTGWLAKAPPAEQRRVYRQAIEALVDVHRLDPQAIGLGHLDRREPDETALASQLRRFREFHVWGSDGATYPVLERGYLWLQENLPADDRAVVNWNDARLGNMLFEDCTLRALLDWELIEIGPPEIDLAWFLWHDRFMSRAFGSDFAGRTVDPLPGAPSAREATDWYANASGHEPRNLEWFEMFAAYRMGVYLMRHGKGLIATGKAPPDSTVDHHNSASTELERMLDEASGTTPRS
jgi:aminoglycoside phosphotransferase (APT) family kinase protein